MSKALASLGAFGIIVYFGIIGGVLFGYFSNIYKLTKCNFKAPYKAEVLRGVGIFVAPMGVIAGYCEIKD